jgi:dTMP kinase
MLIVLEGSEAVGKSTQIRRLVDWLNGLGMEVVSLREPGGTPLGDQLRQILLDPQSQLTPRAEALLFMTSRAELVHRVIRPALDRGATVLLDRFFLSTYAYQVFGRGLGESDVREANHLATGGLVPDLTLLLTLPLDESRRRLEGRGAGPDRMEQASHGFHERVSKAFETFATPAWQSAHPECGIIRAVDARGDEETVFGRLRETAIKGWRGSFPGRRA